MIRRWPLALLRAAAAVSALSFEPVTAAPISYDLPAETAALKPGRNLELVMNNCTGCHSVDFIATQPRGQKDKQDFWRAEVNKMIKAYGAPIDEADIAGIVEYLATIY